MIPISQFHLIISDFNHVRDLQTVCVKTMREGQYDLATQREKYVNVTEGLYVGFRLCSNSFFHIL